jgi:hypothetical protein
MKNVFAFLVLMAVIVLTVGDGLMLSQNGNVLGLIALILLVVTIYFFPALVAWHRFHKHVMAIFVANLFFGWTFVGWVAALVWACMNTTLKPVQQHAYVTHGLGE